MKKMNCSHRPKSSPSVNRRISRLIGFMMLFLFIIVMIIPTTIVIGKGKDLPYLHQFINQFMQKQSGTQKSLLTIGWVPGNGASVMNLANYQNLKIVSPALATIDNQYDLQVNSDPSLTNKIREQGKNVWARLLIQSDTNVNVHSFLADHSKTKEVIRKLNEAAQANNWYGVNVDIENVKREDRQAFSQFMKDLSGQLDKGKILLSIDLPPDPAGRNTNAPFDHELLGKYCDYIIFMGYDQHWSTDPVPGPVTSLPWLKENLQEYIRTGIPPEKLILGLPAYTRVWQLDQQGHVVKDPAMPVQYIENELEQNHRTLTWNPQLGEYYTSYTVNNIQYKIWLPTKKSYDLYLGLVSQFHLAGTAVWNLNQIQPDYWNKIYGMKEKNSNL